MAKLPNNYIEILTYLRDCHPDGMTTGEILALAKKNRYYEFQNSTQISSAIFYMRAKKLVTTFEAHGGKIHKITAHGIVQLDDEIGSASTQPIVMSTEPIDDIIQDIQDGADETRSAEPPAPVMPEKASQKARDLLETFDEHLQIVRTSLIDELAEIKQPCVENKHLKLSVLANLETMFNREIGGIIAEIRRDLEQMGDSNG